MDLNLISDDRESSVADHGWQKVTYPKRNRRQRPSDPSAAVPNGVATDRPSVFRSLEQQADDRRRRIADSHRAAFVEDGDDDAPVRSKTRSDDSGDSDDSDAGENNAVKAGEPKKVKQKKPKKPKVTVAEAASKIDVADLAAFLVDVSGSYEGQHDIQLMRFADYFGRAFSAVSGAQFPWMKMFRESPVAKIADTPLSHVSDALYKTSADWINQHPLEALASFVLWCLDSILADLASQQAGAKASKKAAHQVPSKSQVAIFVVLAIVLRRKPDVLVNLSSTLRETSKYQGQDKLSVIVWMICQAQQGDLCVGLYAWAHILLPIVNVKNCNPQSRDLVLQLVERILSMPKARTILVNGAVRKGERLMTPSALEILLRVTFPPSSARVKATERFEAIYPTLKEVALAGVPGSKAMKQVSQQILSFAAKATGENNPTLSKEASGIFIWCLTQHADCYKQWEKIYEDNLEASVSVLKKLSGQWKEHSSRLSPYEPLREALKNFRHKNEEMLAEEADGGRQALLKEADKYSKAILARVTRGHGCMKGMGLLLIALGVGIIIMSPDLKDVDWEKLPVVLNEKLSEISTFASSQLLAQLSELSVVVNAKLSELSVVLNDLKGH